MGKISKIIGVTALLSIMVCISLSVFPMNASAKETTFKDVNQNFWAYDDIHLFVDHGVINGFGDQTFRPQATLTEDQFVKMVSIAMLGENTEATNGHWANPYYKALAEKDITLDGTNQLAAREKVINRGQVAVIVVKLLSGKTMSLEESVDYMFKENLTKGRYNDRGSNVENYDPSGLLTRAEAVVFLSRILYPSEHIDPVFNDMIISTGPDMPFAVTLLKNDGTVWALGENHYNAAKGEIVRGFNNRWNLKNLQQVKGFHHITHLASNKIGLFASRSDGTVLGLRTNREPYIVMKDATLKNVKQIAGTMGDDYYAFITKDGKFGTQNDCGFYGDGDCGPLIESNVKDVVDVVAVDDFFLMLKSNGDVWYGQRIFGFDRYFKHVEGIKNVKAIDMALTDSGLYALMLKDDGTVWEMYINKWEDEGIFEQLDAVRELTPVKVKNVQKASKIFAGNTSFVLLKDGTVWGWGANQYGQLGTGNASGKHIQSKFMGRVNYTYAAQPHSTPVKVEGLSNVIDIDQYMYQIFALEADGTLLTWGRTSGDFIDYEGMDEVTFTKEELEQLGNFGTPQVIK